MQITCKDKSLLVRWDSLLVLNFGLDVLDRVRRLNFQSDSFSSQSLHEDLHASSESEHQVEGGFFLNVVITKGSAVLKLLAGEDQSLLVGWDSFLILDLSFDIFYRVRRLHFQSDCFSCQSLDEDLHASSQSKDEVKG